MLFPTHYTGPWEERVVPEKVKERKEEKGKEPKNEKQRRENG